MSTRLGRSPVRCGRRPVDGDDDRSQVPALAHPAPEPSTLIGHFILANASDDRDLTPVFRHLLSRSGWHHANSVIIYASYTVVNRRWPGRYESDEVKAAVRQAVAMAPRSDLLDGDVLETVIRQELGEQFESAIDERALTLHRLSSCGRLSDCSALVGTTSPPSWWKPNKWRSVAASRLRQSDAGQSLPEEPADAEWAVAQVGRRI